MYVTLKVRIKANLKEKEILLMYEQIYKAELYKVITDMMTSGNIQYQKRKINSIIDYNSHWMLYQLALRSFKTVKSKKHFQYERSSTWNCRSFRVCNGNLILNFGMLFHVAHLNMPLSITSKEEEYIYNGRVVRLDLTRNETMWFANFIIQKDE